MEEAANIYYDVQGTGTLAMKYERGNLLVPDHEYKNLTTYMHQLHEYYLALATETYDFGFEVIIRSPHVFHYPEEEKFDVEWECLFQLYQKRDLDVQLLTLYGLCKYPTCKILQLTTLSRHKLLTFEHFL